VVAVEAVEPDLADVERAPAYEYVAIVEAAAFAWRNPRLQPKTASSRSPPVHRSDQEGQERLESCHA
jgi:hypothetical protein